jgi:N-acetylglucosaminyl-diphospho-decaprenol L-rhamnosyltransferase
MTGIGIAACVVAHSAIESAAALVADLGPVVDPVVVVSTSATAAHVADLPIANVGYGTAANAAFSTVTPASDWFVVLNDDLRLQPGGAQALHDRLADLAPDVGLWSFTGSSSGIGPRRPGHPNEEPPHGGALAIRSTLFESIGGFDPSFFLYGEEVDLWLRLPREFSSGFESAEFLEHEGAASSGASGWASFELGRATARLNRKHANLGRAGLNTVIRTAHVAVRRRSPRNALAFLGGFAHGALFPNSAGPAARRYGAASIAIRMNVGRIG